MRRSIFPSLVLIIATSMSAFAMRSAADGTAKYPSKPIRLIVPQGAGASNDTVSRVMAVKLGELLGQPLVIDNRPGAGGIIGMEIGAHAVADGYTLLATGTANVVISPQLYKKLAFDPLKDLLPVTLFAMTQNGLVVHPSLPAKSVKELIALAKAAPGKLNMASAGAGSQSHLAAVQFTLLTATNAVHVPYKGGGASVAAVIANESQFHITPLPATLTHIKSGRLRALGVGGLKRATQLPDVPTISEAGVAGFQSTGWVGMLAPKGLPKPIFDKLHAALVKVMSQSDTREQIERQGADPAATTPAEFTKFLAEEWARFGTAIKAAGLKIE